MLCFTLVNASYPFPKFLSFHLEQYAAILFFLHFSAGQRGFHDPIQVLNFFSPVHQFFFCYRLWLLSIVWKKSLFHFFLYLRVIWATPTERPILVIRINTSPNLEDRSTKFRKLSFEWILSSFDFVWAWAQHKSPLRSRAGEHRVLACRVLVSLGKLEVDQPCFFMNFLAQRLFERFCFLAGLKQIWNSVSMFQEFEQVVPFPFSTILFAFQVQAASWYIWTSERPTLQEERRWTTAASSNFQAQSLQHLHQSLKEILSYLQVKLARDPWYCRNVQRPCRSWRSYPPRCQTLSILHQVCRAPHCWRALLSHWFAWQPPKFKLWKLNFTLNYIQATQGQYRPETPSKRKGFHDLQVQTSYLIWDFIHVISSHCRVVSSYLTF